MKGNSQQVTPSLHLGVLSQRLDLPLPGWPRGALAHKSSGRPSGSRPATQKGACRASPSVRACRNPTCSPGGAPCWHQTPPPLLEREEGLALPRAPETGGQVERS